MYLLVGIITLLVGYFLRHWVKRNQFYRRGAGGLQHYSSYTKSVVTRTWERIVMLIGFLLIVIGILTIILHFSRQDEAKEKQKQKTEQRVRK